MVDPVLFCSFSSSSSFACCESNDEMDVRIDDVGSSLSSVSSPSLAAPSPLSLPLPASLRSLLSESDPFLLNSGVNTDDNIL